MKKFLSFFLFFTSPIFVLAQSSTNIVVTTVTPATPPPVIIHRVVVPPSISVTLASQLLAQLDAQAPAGKVISRMVILGNADGSFTATITYANPTGGN